MTPLRRVFLRKKSRQRNRQNILVRRKLRRRPNFRFGSETVVKFSARHFRSYPNSSRNLIENDRCRFDVRFRGYSGQESECLLTAVCSQLRTYSCAQREPVKRTKVCNKETMRRSLSESWCSPPSGLKCGMITSGH